MKRWFGAIVLGVAVTNAGVAQKDAIRIDVTTDKNAFENVPLCIPLSVPKRWATTNDVLVSIVGKDTVERAGQLTTPGIVTESIPPAQEGFVRRDLHVVLPAIEAGGSRELVVTSRKVRYVVRFGWTENDRKLLLWRLQTDAGPAAYAPNLQYMNQAYDTSSKEAREKSYKVFHHLYDPAGKRFVTNGGFTNDGVEDPKKLLYPHHRGIMYGFNKCTFGPDLKMQADTWHCPSEGKKVTNAAHVAHEKTLLSEAGPVLGRHRVLLGWYGSGDKPFALEERELTVYNVKGGTLVEFASRLKTTGGKVHVDGDPQHAGFQFRASNDVAVKTKSQTYYLHPDGKGEMGKERNWPADKSMVDLPWYAMSYVLDGQRYTTCYLNHPSNPKDTRFSERDYGRFGGYFAQDITEDQPLVVHYRLWLQTGEMTPEQATSLRTAFASPPKTTVAK